ncbi:MAG: Na(+)-translocating NADH-quinone reductase subunit A [Bacteroidales bacterium]|jgi:Na+-transporting NADH:ubiquinone oxidoreductase subunit A|nr:Na(+)-translocating NADH-quinone reductase subunit A [Bacteroidales bacterium]
MQKVINIHKGLNIKLKGESESRFLPFNTTRFALVPDHYRWVTPKLLLKEGEPVQVGTPIFYAKENEKIVFVSPVSGQITKIQRGEKRKIEYIEITSDEQNNSVGVEIPHAFTAENIKETLLQYGLWNLIRELPFNVIADTEKCPKAIFISGFDTAPLAPDSLMLLDNRFEELQAGINVLAKLTSGKVHLSLYQSNDNQPFEQLTSVEFRYFKGKHPAGNIGTQIHHIEPINKGETVWHIGLQELVIIGKLFKNQKLDFTKNIALTGGGINETGYIKITQGADISTAIKQRQTTEMPRIISGNVFTGKLIGEGGFADCYVNQITVIPEGGERRFLGWLEPGFRHWSFSRSYLSWLFPKKKYRFDTSLNGGVRTLMLTTEYEKVFPFNIFPTELLKACIIEDIDLMEALGIYEVTEEDFALCEFICPSKMEWQEIILKGLTLLKK